MKTYLALGDSYTIGEGTLPEDRFPNQLITNINDNSEVPLFKSPTIIATTGWTTDELLAAIKNSELEAQYDLVSLLIGVNNQYRKYPQEQFIKEFTALLNIAITKGKNGAASVFVLTIPDWGNTKFGSQHETHQPATVTSEIDKYNSIICDISSKNDVPVIDITTLTRATDVMEKYLVEDGLHYNKDQHALWVAAIMNQIPHYFRY